MPLSESLAGDVIIEIFTTVRMLVIKQAIAAKRYFSETFVVIA